MNPIKDLSLLYNQYPDRLHLLVVFIVLQILDILTTQSFISMGHPEGNPIMAWVIRKGWTWVWVVKLLIICLTPSMTLHSPRTFTVLLYIYLFVIVSNTHVVRDLIKLSLHG